MNRRESLKAIGLSTLAAGMLIDACKPKDKEAGAGEQPANKKAAAGRQEFEEALEKKLNAETFFTAHEMTTITLLANIIIPKDDRSGSASDAKVPEFIEFIVKDIPEHQLPMRGGIRWLDRECVLRYKNAFSDCSKEQQMQLVDAIAYPNKAKTEMQPGVAFFNRMRDLTATGFFTSKMGIEDLGYAGNQPGKWEGVPVAVLQQYGMEKM